MDYENLCTLSQKMDSKVRFAGVINSKGRLIAGGMAPSIKRLGDRKRDEMLYHEEQDHIAMEKAKETK